ncbi:type II secretion system protein GspM [Longibaculum muris]|uniref:type II secretion system protein GspM n=1 Tax=Longibaculum muris TaxID=1796628 RepID=UPI0022E1B951|nr:type II secretion system protein GspM [Longibaculum muris]
MKEIVDQLSSREKKLLYFLVCFLIVVGGWFFVIVPALDKNTVLNKEYQDILMENASIQTDLSQYLSAQDQLKVEQDNLKQVIENYNPILSTEKIDKLITTTFLSQGLTPTSLTLSDVTAVKIKKAKDDKKETTTNETDEKIKELTKTDKKNNDDKTSKDKTDEKDKDDETSKDKTDKKKEEKDYVFQAKVNVSVMGTLNQITKTIDEFNKMKGVEISKFNFSESTDPTKPATASLEIVVYMAEQ